MNPHMVGIAIQVHRKQTWEQLQRTAGMINRSAKT